MQEDQELNRRVRRSHTAQFKAEVALAALRQPLLTPGEIASMYGIRSRLVSEWTRILVRNASSAFSMAPTYPVELEMLRESVKRLARENADLQRRMNVHAISRTIDRRV